jgi:hypothetical protein
MLFDFLKISLTTDPTVLEMDRSHLHTSATDVTAQATVKNSTEKHRKGAIMPTVINTFSAYLPLPVSA